MKNTLLLHIGTPKTGTTALQKFLSENSEELKKQGWDFPDMLKEWQIQYGERAYKSTQRNGLLLRWSIIKKWSEEKKEKLWQMILKHLQSSNVILSDEVIWDYDPSTTTAEIIRSVKNRYDNIKIVCYYYFVTQQYLCCCNIRPSGRSFISALPFRSNNP